MAPRKRKAAVASDVAVDATTQQERQPGHSDLLQAVSTKLELLDAAVEERCEAIMAAADAAVASLMQELKMQLIQLPKKVREMPYKDYMALQAASADQQSAAAAVAAAAAIDSKLQHVQEIAEGAATAAPTTRSLRSRARSVMPAAPQTVRVTRSRQPVPKFTSASSKSAVDAAPLEPAGAEAGYNTISNATGSPVDPAAALKRDETGSHSSAVPVVDTADCRLHLDQQKHQQQAQQQGDEEQADQHTPGGVAAAPAAAAITAAAASGAVASTSEEAARRAAAVGRAQAKVDARLAAIGAAAAGTTRATGGRTALRALQPGETCFSRNGSPLSIHPNITRGRRRNAAAAAVGPNGWPAMTPAMAAATAAAGGAAAAGDMVGCFTLIKRQGVVNGAAAATGRAGRSRAAAAAAAAGTAGSSDTAMVIMTDDGNSYAVDGAAGGLKAVPATHREEVAEKLRAIQALAAKALGV